MKSFGAFKAIKGTDHVIPKEHKLLKATAATETVTVTLILRRRKGPKLRGVKDFAKAKTVGGPVDRQQFAASYGADPAEIDQVLEYARAMGLDVVDTNPAARSVVLRGAAGKINKAFGVKLQTYQGTTGKYHSHTGKAKLPGKIATVVEAVIGLHSRPVRARAFNTSRLSASVPPNTNPVTPQQIAELYGFPAGDGAGQTIGIYEMTTADEQGNPAPAGYTKEDVANTLAAFGGNLQMPNIIDVSVDGVTNSGVEDGETLLDITVAGAVAQAATLAVYFTGAETQSIVHALQSMIHPKVGDPVPTIISISYGWGGDDDLSDFSAAALQQIDALFQDAANLNITVLISSGDSGCYLGTTHVQASFPATEPMVIACGGTAVGNINGTTFDEYAWNQGARGGATGGGVSVRYGTVPSYQAGAGVPKNLYTKKPGRGVPDLAGNASPSSGYMQVSGSTSEPVGGTSAVAPLYAALIARINSNLGKSVGFINAVLYKLSASAFRDVVAPPGPANNSFNGVTGYPVTKGWDACTGLGSVKGTVLQDGLKAGSD